MNQPLPPTHTPTPTPTPQRASQARAAQAPAGRVPADHRGAVRAAAHAADPQGGAHGGAGPRRLEAQAAGKEVFVGVRAWVDGGIYV